jgi:hypothetical protein
METEAEVLAQPSHDLFSFVDAKIVTYNMNPGDMFRDNAVEVIQEGNELYLAFASKTSPIHSACPGIKSGKEIERALAEVFVFHTNWFPGSCRFGRLLSGTGLQGCFLIKRQHHLVGK